MQILQMTYPMKRSIQTLSLGTAVWASLAGAAGGMDGGGGKGVVCRNDAGRIVKAELLDLYEARIVTGLSIVESSESVESQIASVTKKLVGTAGLEMAVGDHALTIKDRLARMLPEGTALTPTDDSLEVIVPTNCKIEQVANYRPDSSVLVSGEIYSAFNETNKAALWLHESIYHFERQSASVTDSRITRRVVGELFSDRAIFEPKLKDVKPGDVFCIGSHASSGMTVLFGYKNLEAIGFEDKYRLEFAILNGHSFYSKAYIDVPSFLPDSPFPGTHVIGGIRSKFDPAVHEIELIYLADNGKPVVTLGGKRLAAGTADIETTKLVCRPATEALISLPW